MPKRPLALAAVLAVAGAVAGLAASFASSSEQRGVVTLAAQVGGSLASPQDTLRARLLVATLVDVARSDPVVTNLASSAQVPAGAVRNRLHVDAVAGTALIRVAYDDPSGADAKRLAEQAAVVVQSIVAARFGRGGRPVTLEVTEPVRLEAGVSRPILRDVVVGALLGLLLGAAVGGYRARASAQEHPPEQVAREADRSDPAPVEPLPPAPPTEEASARHAEIRERVRAAAPAAGPQAEPEPLSASVDVVEAEPSPEPAPVPRLSGGWEVRELELLTVRAGGPMLEERLAYLGALRQQARGGVLGPEFDSLVYEFFGDLVG